MFVKLLAERCQAEFKELGADIEKLKAVKTPFPRITYKEAIERLKTKNPALNWGADLGYEDEKVLAEDFGKPFFVYDYPNRNQSVLLQNLCRPPRNRHVR